MSGSLVFNMSMKTVRLSQKIFVNSPVGTNFGAFSTLGHAVREHCLRNKKILVGLQKDFSIETAKEGSAARAETTATTQGLSKLQAQELVLRLTDDERDVLISALQEFNSKRMKDVFEGQLAATRWRSKFGRPSKLPTLGDVDPTGSYCAVPEDWLRRKCADAVPRPSTRNLIDMAVANSIPFIGFGFLDNFFMLIFGDYIDIYLGSYFVLTTMAAAALGNTFSDVLGIGTAFYVERLANKVGFNPPRLTPAQMDMPVSRHFANMGRVIGVTIGCLLGMVPLLFFKHKDEEKGDAKGKGRKKAEDQPKLTKTT